MRLMDIVWCVILGVFILFGCGIVFSAYRQKFGDKRTNRLFIIMGWAFFVGSIIMLIQQLWSD